MVLKWCLLAFAITCASAIDVKEDYFDLSIIHFNDFHARFEETSRTSTKCVPEAGECIGGFPRLYTAIHDLKARKPQAVVLNAGDSFQGTLWYNILRWNVTQFFMNKLPLDAHTLGNHEFDHAVEGVTGYLKHLTAPMVVCNIDDSDEPTMQGLYKNSIVIEREGEKIGIIGVIIATTDQLANTDELRFTDEVKAVKEESDLLAAQGVNKIIVLSHCGLDIDRIIARDAGSNIDVIVGAHSHTLLYTGPTPSGETAADVYPVVVNQASGTTVLIVQASAYTKYLGDLTVSFDAEGKVKKWSGAPYYLDSSYEQNKEMLELMQPFKDIVDEAGQRSIGSSRVVLSRSGCGSTECNLGDFITDSLVNYMTKFAKEGQWTYAAVALINQGGIRANIDSGIIKYEDLIIAQPFGNMIQTFDIKGKHILETLEFSVNRTNNGPFHSQIFLQVSGLRITYDVSKPPGERVVQALIKCAECEIPYYLPINPEAKYKIVTVSFLGDGGDGFYDTLTAHRENVEIWGVDEEAVEEYIIKQTPITHGEDRRIIML